MRISRHPESVVQEYVISGKMLTLNENDSMSVREPPFVAHAFQLLWGYLTALCWLYLGEKGSSMSGSISEYSAYTWMIQPD